MEVPQVTSKILGDFFQIFVAFSEYMYFIYHKTHMQFGTL
jgi:hypothetical protein